VDPITIAILAASALKAVKDQQNESEDIKVKSNKEKVSGYGHAFTPVNEQIRRANPWGTMMQAAGTAAATNAPNRMIVGRDTWKPGADFEAPVTPATTIAASNMGEGFGANDLNGNTFDGAQPTGSRTLADTIYGPRRRYTSPWNSMRGYQ
jgi:hypothetical protein